MKLLTKNADYAIRALIELGTQKEGFISARYISKRQKIPYSYLRKILQILVNNQVVEAKEGGKGGFRLKLLPAEIGLLDVINILQGKKNLSDCLFRKKLCRNRDNCVLRENILEIEKLVVEKFKKITVKKLINQGKLKRGKR